MNRRFWLRALTLAATSCVALIGVAPGSHSRRSLDAAVSAVVQSPAYRQASFGVAVYDLDTNRFVDRYHADRLFLAASTTKLLTEGASLAFLGSNYRFTTNVYRTGPVDSTGTLHGDLVLRASGDPNLSNRERSNGTLAYENEDHSYDGGALTRAVPGDPLALMKQFAAQIAGDGIRRITGKVIVDDGLFPGGFAEMGTGAIVSPIVVNDNLIDVYVAPGAAPGDPARLTTSPRTPYVTFVNQATTGASQSERTVSLQDVSGRDSRRTVVITGSMPVDSPRILYAYDIPSPPRFAEIALAQELRHDGVAVPPGQGSSLVPHASVASSEAAANLVATHVSAPLSQDVKVTLKVSDNLHADIMPYLWDHGDLIGGFAMERRFLESAGLDTSEVVQSDGLGGNAYIEPQFMVKYLAFLRKQPYFHAIADALPVLGRNGSLFNVQMESPAAGHVEAKTGTWSYGNRLDNGSIAASSGLAGYVTTRSGHHLAFCFYLNNLAVPQGEDAASVAGNLLAKLAAVLYQQG